MAHPQDKKLAKARLITIGDRCDSIAYRAELVPSSWGVSAPTAEAAWSRLTGMAGPLEPADTETEILLGLYDTK